MQLYTRRSLGDIVAVSRLHHVYLEGALLFTAVRAVRACVRGLAGVRAYVTRKVSLVSERLVTLGHEGTGVAAVVEF